MHFTIVRSLYPNKLLQPIEHPTTGHVSIIGQILLQLGQPTKAKDNKAAYILSDIHKLSPFLCGPFARQCNNKTVQTDLTTNLINTSPENEYAVAELLRPHGITINFEE